MVFGDTFDDITSLGLRPLIKAGVPGKVDSRAIRTPQSDQFDAQIQQAKDYQKKANQQAKDYRSNLKGVQEQYMSSANDQARSNLARNMAGARSQANARGLLYSGQAQAGQAGAMQDYASGLAEARQNINAATQAQAQDYDRMAQESNQGIQDLTMQQAAIRQAAAEEAYKNAVRQQMADSQGYKDITQAGAGLLGTMLSAGRR